MPVFEWRPTRMGVQRSRRSILIRSPAAAVVVVLSATFAMSGCTVGSGQEEPMSVYVINGCSTPILAGATEDTALAGWSIPSTLEAIAPGGRATARSDFDLASVGPAIYLWVSPDGATSWPAQPSARVLLSDMTIERTNPAWPSYLYEVSGPLCPG